MGDFVYDGAHSIDIVLPNGVKINTWDKWKIAPAARPFVASPPIKEEYVDVPGADGMLDYTDILAGTVRYGNRTGSWQFLVDNGYFEWTKLQSEILNTLHGKKCKVILTDEPEYYYEGRITVGTAFGNKDYAGIIFNYNFGPYKWPIGTNKNKWWKWNDLFMNTIIYGNFTVNGWMARNLINETSGDINATIDVTYGVDVYPYDGSEQMQYTMLSNAFDVNKDLFDHVHLTTGSNTYTLHPGNNYMFFVGNANVTVEYERGKTL